MNNVTSPAFTATNLSKRYGTKWALQDCNFELIAGRIAALVGPNGAGKTTLLQMAAGLLKPSSGLVQIFGFSPSKQARQILPLIGFVGQRSPLYPNFTVAEMLKLGAKLNRYWDSEFAHNRLKHLSIPLSQPTAKLSGGQKAQVALVLALAKRPRLLLLDEPLANLDPLARHEFMQVLLGEVSEHGITAVLSSHSLAELERACDYLLILATSQLQLAGDITSLTNSHLFLSGPRAKFESLPKTCKIIWVSHTDRQSTLLVRIDENPNQLLIDPIWRIRTASLEELILAYLERAANPLQTAAVIAKQPPLLQLVSAKNNEQEAEEDK